MQAKQVTRRLQQVQQLINVNGHDSSSGSTQPSIRKRVLILPDDSEVYVSGPIGDGFNTVSVGERDIASYRPLARVAALVLSAFGTPFEKNNPVPKYPVLEIHAVSDEAVCVDDIWAVVYALWTLFHSQENIPVLLAPSFPARDAAISFLLRSGLARAALDPAESALFLLRGTFWQGAGTGPVWGNTRGWLRYAPSHDIFPHVQSFTRSSNVIAQHPLRPPKPPAGTVIYRRYCAEVGRMFAFHVFDPDNAEDMDAFHKWQNKDRVNSAWGEQGDFEKHRVYIRGKLSDPAALTLIMNWDGERMGYCEMVWIQENHVAPYVPTGARDYDRGMHVLVGEDKFRGRIYSKIWFRTILHYIFLADPRTERMIGEPQSLNATVLELGRQCGMHNETSFYFPYKHSCLEVGLRERFFKEDMLV